LQASGDTPRTGREAIRFADTAPKTGVLDRHPSG
jgi:hypothetical protein